MQKAKEFFEGTDIPWANFHTFRREAGTVALKHPPEEEPQVDPETGSLLSAADIQTLESFCGDTASYFGKMYSYLMEFMEKGVGEGRFTGRQARRDLQIALWYAYACNNLDEYTMYYRAAQWMPASEENAKGCGMWYYRYSCALHVLRAAGGGPPILRAGGQGGAGLPLGLAAAGQAARPLRGQGRGPGGGGAGPARWCRGTMSS